MGEWVCICMGHVIVVVVKATGGLLCHLHPHCAICVPIVPSACPGDAMEGGGYGWMDTGMRVGGHARGEDVHVGADVDILCGHGVWCVSRQRKEIIKVVVLTCEPCQRATSH